MKNKETLEEAAERILANNIDGLRDALQDDDLFFFYKGVVQCYGEAMAKYQQNQDKKLYSEEEVFKLTLDALDLGMKIRQDQLRGYSEKSGKELHKEWFEQNKNK